MTRDSPLPNDEASEPPVRGGAFDEPDGLFNEDQRALRSIVAAEQSETRAIRDLLEFGVDRLAVENGHLTRIRPGPGTHTFDAVVNPLSSIQEGETQDLSATYCRKVIAEGGILSVHDAPNQGWLDDPAYRRFELDTYVGTKVLSGDALYGTLCFVAGEARETPFGDEECALVHYLAQWMGVLIEQNKHSKGRANALRRKQERFKQLVQSVEEYAIFMLGPDGRVQTWNAGAKQIKKYSRDEILGEHFSTFYTEEDRAAGVPAKILESAETQGSVRKEGWQVRKDGSRFWGEVTITALREEDGTLRGFAKVTRDLTEWKRLEEQRRQTTEQLSTILDANPNPLIALDQSGCVDFWNPAAERIFGWSEEEVLGEPVPFIPPEKADQHEELRDRVLAGEPLRGVDVKRHRRDGSRIDVRLSASPLRDDEGTITGIMVVLEEVTERKEREERLRETTARLRGIANSVPGVVFQLYARPDGSRGLYFLGERAEALLGMSSDPEGGFDRFVQHVPEGHRDAFLSSVKEAIETQSFWEHEVPFETDSGERLWLRGLASPQVQEEELIFNGVLLNVAEKKEGEHTLQDRKRKVKSLYATISELLEAEDANEVAHTVRELINEVFGYPIVLVRFRKEEQLVPVEASSEIPEHMPERPPFDVEGESIVAHAFRENQTVVSDDLRAYDDPFEYGEVRATAVAPMGQHGTISVADLEVGTIEDFDCRLIEVLAAQVATVLDRIEREHTLQRERDLLDRILQTSPSAITVLDPEGNFTHVSDRAQNILGLEKDEVTDRTFNDPGWRITAPDGSSFPNEDFPFARVKETEEPVFGVEHAIEWPDGARRLLSVSGAPLHDAEGAFMGAVFHLDDITERRNAKRALRKSEQRFRGVFENAALGIALIDVDTGTILEANPALASMLERDRESLRGTHFEEITHPDDLAADRHLYEELVAGHRDQYQLEKRYVRPSGEAFWGRLTVSRWETPGVIQGVGMIENIDAQKKRKEDLRLYQKMVEQAEDAILLTESEPLDDAGPEILYANPAFAELTGYAAEEVVDRTAAILRGPDTQSQIIEEMHRRLKEGRAAEGEAINYRRDGTPFINSWNVAPVRDERGEITHLVSVQRDVTEQRRMQERLLEVQEEERRRIDQKIHDEMGGLLTSLQMTVELARHETQEDAAITERLDEIEAFVTDLSDTARTISRKLYPSALSSHGLVEALPSLIGEIEKHHEIDVTLKSDLEEGVRFSSLVERTACWIANEALFNVARHAETDEAHVEVTTAGERLDLHVIDEGCGFDPTVQDEERPGIEGIQRRTEHLKGDFDLDTAPGEGTRISASLPLTLASLPR